MRNALSVLPLRPWYFDLVGLSRKLPNPHETNNCIEGLSRESNASGCISGEDGPTRSVLDMHATAQPLI